MCFLLLILQSAIGQQQMLDSGWHHIRNTGPREWAEFPKEAEATRLLLTFPSDSNVAERTLSLRQYDVKLQWQALLNGRPLGMLVEDEKDLICYLEVPAGVLRPNNTLEISTTDKRPDDIRVGHVALHSMPRRDFLSQAHIAVSVVDDDSGEPIPSRITIVNGRGTLQSVAAQPAERLAVRPGYVYTAAGNAILGLPAGAYALYATRGFEYGVDSAQIVLKKGDTLRHQFSLKREVPTAGWVGSDTHVHTFTWSKHGDATAAERVITIAGEGLELPVITDHNIHADLKPFGAGQGVEDRFTLVMGNEVTTRVGHFNVFPAAERVIIHDVRDWKSLARNIGEAAGAVILNHARDIHLGFRPFDTTKHLSSAGMRLDNWQLPANAMEVINSGSQQTDQFELARDWFGMLNGGHIITPVGSSDSHDVSRFIVGQARTYIRCNDDDPGNIDIEEAVKNFVDGNVMVSFGLLAGIEINDAYGPGELVPPSDQVKVSVKVLGPSWLRAEKVALYANGKKIREEVITRQDAPGLKWSGDWNLTVPAQDIFLVAMAEGPSDDLPYWPIAKPFQPVSTTWNPRVFALSGAVWLDGDKNGQRNSARDYAAVLVRQAGTNMHALMQSLAPFNESVSVQAAALLYQKRKNLKGPAVTSALENAAPQTKDGFKRLISELPE